MGAQLRVYKRRIQAVTATKKITKAMEMIAASRIVKAQRKVAASMPYATELTRAVTAVATGSNTNHPLTTEAESPARAAVLLLTSDRGLAGGYSSNAIKAAERLRSGWQPRARRSTRTSSAARVSRTTASVSARSRSRGRASPTAPSTRMPRRSPSP